MAEEVTTPRPRRTRARTARRIVGSGVAVLATLWAVAPIGAQGQPTPVEPVEIRIYNAHEALAPTLTWADIVPTIPGTPQMSQTARGDAEGKRQLIEGRSDAVVSGTAFTDAELADLDATGRGVIAAPVQAVGMTVFASGPKPFGIDLCSEQEVPDEGYTACLKVRDFEGPLRLNSEDLADVFLESGRNNWQNPVFLEQFRQLEPLGQLSMLSPLRPAAPVLRSDAGMVNVALGTYLRTLQPAKWSTRSSSLFLDPEPGPSAAWPFVGAPVRSNMPDAVSIVRQWKTASAATDVPAENGAMTLSTPLAATQAIAEEAEEPPFDAEGRENLRTDLYIAQLQNGAGEWLSATPESITTALAAGDGAPLYGMTENVPGAWPLSWVNTLYVPDSGLTGDEANTIAAVIRWQSTVGRQNAAQLLDGQLPGSKIDQALDAADEIVESNCSAAGLDTITTDEPARFAPNGTLADLGDTVWCDTPVKAAAIPSGGSNANPFVAAAGTASGSSSSGSSSSGGATRPLSASSASSGSGASADGSTGSASEPVTLSAEEFAAIKVSRTMPLPMPDPTAPFDRLATLALGGGLYLLGRGLLRRWGVISA